MENAYDEAREFIQNADAILITAGAGMGVDSGLPDFRGDEGFWKAYPAIKDLGISFVAMANPEWFESEPTLAWAFYGHRLNLYTETIPHQGFGMLLELVKKKNDDYFIFSSNVDGQFQKAGFAEEKIVEVHGSIHHFQCTKNCTSEIWDADVGYVAIDEKKFRAITTPQCKNCNAIARPNILMFGDWSWNDVRTNDQEERYYKWLQKLHTNGKKLAIIEIGAGLAVPTVRMEGENIASQFRDKAKLIRINPRDFQLNGARGYSIKLGGYEGLEKIL